MSPEDASKPRRDEFNVRPHEQRRQRESDFLTKITVKNSAPARLRAVARMERSEIRAA
jgi:hypothetical protein